MVSFRIILLVSFCAVGLILPTATFANRDVFGLVTDGATGLPVSTAVVKILETADSTQTDGTGHYFFANLPEGQYTFLVGFENYSPRILTNVSVSASCCVGESVGNLDSVPGTPDMGDLTLLIDMLFISLAPISCLSEANVDFQPLGSMPEPLPEHITMGDLTVLIDNLFISLSPLPACP